MKTKAAEQFPLEIKKGHAVAKVYRGENRGTPIYTVSWVSPTQGRQRRFFRDLEEARREAGNVVHHLSMGDLEALRLTGQERQQFVAAAEAVRPTGLALDAAAREFAEAWAVLGGRAGVIEAARYYVANVGGDLPALPLAAAVAEFRRAKEAEGASKLHLKDLRLYLGRLVDHFPGCLLRAIGPGDLRGYLERIPAGPQAKTNHRRTIRSLFAFARKQGWLRSPTAADELATFRVPERDVAIYRPQQVAALLAHADADLRPWLVLMAFGGCRREELRKGLDWSALDFATGRLTIPAAIAKTGRKRKIDLADNARAWLEPYRGRTGPIFAARPDPRVRALAAVAGVTLKRNALRHSFGSYQLEQVRNAGQVALEMGNSPAVVLRHYHELVSAADCAAFWSIRPPVAG